MLDIGFSELLLIAVIALLVLGPERMPDAVRSTTRFLGKIKNGFNQLKTEFEREAGADDLRREIHNQAILEQLNATDSAATAGLDDIRKDLQGLEFDVNATPTDNEKA